MSPSRRSSGLVVIASVAVLLSGCAPEVVTPPAVTMTAVPTENRIVVPSPPVDPMPATVWPLTGLSAEGATQADLDRPSIGVKIENTARGRPQKGLESADLVFEEYINLNCTRLMAFFQSDPPESVGPIRSARNMDPNIIGSFNTALVASGTNRGVELSWPADQPFIDNDMISRKSSGAFWHSEGFERVTRSEVDKDLEFRLWGHPATFASEAIAGGIGPTPQQFDYAYPAEEATAIVEGAPVGNIDVRFSSCANPHWVWDEDGGAWDRFEFTKPDVTLDGNQVTATNVLILRVKVVYSQPSIPESIVVVTDPQPGYIATGGKVTPILWTKTDRRDKFHLTTPDGGLVYLAPGTTWIELLPISGQKSTVTLEFDDIVQ